MFSLLIATVGTLLFLALRTETGPSGLASGELGTPMMIWTYPSNDAEGVNRGWDGKDSPQPMAPPNGYPSGPVLTLQVGGGLTLDVKEALVMQEPSGSLVEATILTGAQDSFLNAATVAVIPHEPLKPLTTYTVEVQASAGGTPFSESWSFTTRRDGCDLVEQDCSIGRGCFLLSTGKQCLWAGRGQAGDSCEHANQCAVGLTCMGSTCLPFCDARAEPAQPSLACSGHCPGGIVNVPGAQEDEPARVCVLENCAKDASICNEGEACYWIGTFLCAEQGEGPPGTPCTQARDCAAGTSCLGHEGNFACHTLCGGNGMPSCEKACGEEALLFDSKNEISFCP